MAKPQTVRPDETRPAQPALSAGVRHHLGENLRSLYTDTLAAPVSERLDALIAQLKGSKR